VARGRKNSCPPLVYTKFVSNVAREPKRAPHFCCWSYDPPGKLQNFTPWVLVHLIIGVQDSILLNLYIIFNFTMTRLLKTRTTFNCIEVAHLLEALIDIVHKHVFFSEKMLSNLYCPKGSINVHWSRFYKDTKKHIFVLKIRRSMNSWKRRIQA